MIDENKENNTYRAICDCCYEMSDEYDSFNECLHGIKEDGWKSHYDKQEGEWTHLCEECREDLG